MHQMTGGYICSLYGVQSFIYLFFSLLPGSLWLGSCIFYGWVLKYFIIALLFRGIDVVRNKIKMFAQKKVTLPPGRHKIVILDEADR